jgi:hypothetical protein
MIKTLVLLEVGLAAAIFLLAAAQYLGLSQARREGRTQNVSRLMTYGTLMALTVIYAVGNLIWLGSAQNTQDVGQIENLPTVNWTFLIIAVMIGILAAWDLVTHIRFAACRAQSEQMAGLPGRDRVDLRREHPRHLSLTGAPNSTTDDRLPARLPGLQTELVEEADRIAAGKNSRELGKRVTGGRVSKMGLEIGER